MDTRQALALLVELAKWEVENPAVPDPPEDWQRELSEAVTVVRRLLGQLHPANRVEHKDNL